MASLGVVVLSALLRPFDAPDLPSGYYYRVMPVVADVLEVQVRKGNVATASDLDPVFTSAKRTLAWGDDDYQNSARGVTGALALAAGGEALSKLKVTGRQNAAAAFTGVYA